MTYEMLHKSENGLKPRSLQELITTRVIDLETVMT